MAGKIYKIIRPEDKTSTRTLLHESIPITGSLLSGTYTVADPNQDENIQNFSHGMFQAVYDYPYLSSSANHIFDITAGYSANSALSASSGRTQQSKKINIYNQMAQVLAGHQTDGTIREFDEDGDLTGGTKIRECYFLNFSRLLTKDEIKKGSFELELGTAASHNYTGGNFSSRIKVTDVSGSNGYKVNSPAGEYGILYATASAGTNVLSASATMANDGLNQIPCGLVYYQAGVVVLSGSVFTSEGYATAVDCIDTTGYVSSNADASFTISIPTTCGGLGGTAVTILLDADQNGGHTTNGADKIAIGTFDGSETDALAASYIIDAINGVPTATNARIVYASSGNGEAADSLGITAKQGSSDTQITLTIDKAGPTGNITSALASVTGLDIIDVTAFTGGGYVLTNSLLKVGEVDMSSAENGTETISDLLTGSTIQTAADAFRSRIYNLQFNNTTELNSTVYFCRANHNEFNYSSNPTYTSGSKIRVKEQSVDVPVTYVTSVGLYDARKRLVAVAKLSEPIKKTPENEVTFRVRLDY